MFKNRQDAGHRLAQALHKYKYAKDTIVLAIPRGGVEVGVSIAKDLHLPFSIIISRKLPFPDNPESGFGAVAEDGSLYLYPNTVYWLPQHTVQDIIQEQRQEIMRRQHVLRDDEPLPDITGKTVILVDDGIAMGSTMHASIQLVKNKGAKHIIIAAPVASAQIIDDLRRDVDRVVVLEVPHNFYAVAQVYEHWYDVPDNEVKTLMRQYNVRIPVTKNS
jgi:putative phosphoribosyl transferase